MDNDTTRHGGGGVCADYAKSDPRPTTRNRYIAIISRNLRGKLAEFSRQHYTKMTGFEIRLDKSRNRVKE